MSAAPSERACRADRRAPSTFAVPAGPAVDWVLAILLSGLVDPSPRVEATLLLFFALLAMISVPWWIAPPVVAMAVSWVIVYGFGRALSTLA